MAVPKKATPPAATGEVITIKRLETENIKVPIVGDSPLVVHKFSEKAKRTMLDAMQGIKKPKGIRDPEADYESSMYRIAKDGDDGYGFPAIAFKSATVSAARFYDKSISMTALRQFIFFKGIVTKLETQQLVEIIGEPEMREDVVRLSMSSTDLRYRAQFYPWSAELDITYMKSCISRDSVLSLIDAGGMGVGVGEWRPERKGEFGCYHIDTGKEIVIV